MDRHFHLVATEHDGSKRFTVVERDHYRASTAALVIRRCGGKILKAQQCDGDYQTCRRAAFNATAEEK